MDNQAPAVEEDVFDVFVISCETGCSCCSYENHELGFYASREDADRRINRFLNPALNDNPVASQYARKGRYSVYCNKAEKISRGRIIVSNRVYDFKSFAVVAEDGSATGEERI